VNYLFKSYLTVPFRISIVPSIIFMFLFSVSSSLAEIQRSNGNNPNPAGRFLMASNFQGVCREVCVLAGKMTFYQFITSDYLQYDSDFCPVGTTFCCWNRISRQTRAGLSSRCIILC